jgi:hypothetical protein
LSQSTLADARSVAGDLPRVLGRKGKRGGV